MNSASSRPYVNLNHTQVPLRDSVVNSIHNHNKPSWSRYVFYSSLLVLMSPLTTVASVYLFTVNYFKKKDPEHAAVQKKISDYLKKKNKFHVQPASNIYVISTTECILKLASAHLKPVILDVLALDRNFSHISHILQGANVKIVEDKGMFFNQWKDVQGARKRKSSHPSDQDGAYSFRGDFFHEFLFWKDPVTHCTRFQLEKSSCQIFSNPAVSILHARDYLNYKRFNLQQGPFGESPITDNHPICIHYNKNKFKSNQKTLKDLLPSV